MWPGLDGGLLDGDFEVNQHLLRSQLKSLPFQLQLDHRKEDGVGHLLLVRQEAVDHWKPLLSHLRLKTIVIV